ncbi:hypothetical protein [Aureispira sp. CCB-E]|uniref:hypothetical protein n=1 Tax=Aureispira sp. CCB-E TaxID=3051121 RepID=UPI002868A8D8|nr:hypothetical protein [Aureispira sp. CCB-E]WMX16511.1 hypothetical protein QP953_09045 [Aureispira sp. CCB-E]
MDVIHQNPFRICGIYSNAGEREIRRVQSRLNAYLNIGRTVALDIDFSLLKTIDRTPEIVEQASSKIEQNKDRVNHSYFWFLKHSSFDETSLKYLSSGDTEKAIQIWTKVTHNKNITSKNFSSFSNLGTIKLLSNSNLEVEEGLRLKMTLLESQYLKDYLHEIADETFKVDKDLEIERFLNGILPDLEARFKKEKIISIFGNAPNSPTHQFLLKKFSSDYIHSIESQIARTKEERKAKSPGHLYNLGFNLLNETQADINSLKKVLGIRDLNYKVQADSLAVEIMQCGIDYFIAFRKNSDPSEKALKLLTYSYDLAISPMIKDRASENIEGIKEWAKTAKIQSELNFIYAQVEKFEATKNQSSLFGSVSVESIKRLLVDCTPQIQNIKTKMTKWNEEYQNISNFFVQFIQRELVSVINDAVQSHSSLSSLQSKVEIAWEITCMLDHFDMYNDMRRTFNENKTALKSIARQIDVSTLTPEEKERERKKREIKTVEDEIKKVKKLRKILNEKIIKVEHTKAELLFRQEDFRKAEERMKEIKKWHFLRLASDRERQINTQQERIDNILSDCNEKKRQKIKALKKGLKIYNEQLENYENKLRYIKYG